MAGKGSKRRKENYKNYTSNYDKINWAKTKIKREVKQESKQKKC